MRKQNEEKAKKKETIQYMQKKAIKLNNGLFLTL